MIAVAVRFMLDPENIAIGPVVALIDVAPAAQVITIAPVVTVSV